MSGENTMSGSVIVYKEGTTMFGSVIVYKEGTTREEAEKVIQELIDRGILDANSSRSVNEFNPDWGGPVWYTP